MTGMPPALVGPKEPKPPEDGLHEPLHFLSHWFYRKRRDVLADRHYNPWEGKHLKVCKSIIKDKAGGDLEEVRRRCLNLVAWFRFEPHFWSLEPKCLLGQWERLALPPVINGGRTTVKRNLADAERDARRQQLEQEVRRDRSSVDQV